MYVCEPPYEPQGRREAAAAIIESIGPRAVLVPSSNHPDIMAGQGTIALEMFEQVHCMSIPSVKSGTQCEIQSSANEAQYL